MDLWSYVSRKLVNKVPKRCSCFGSHDDVNFVELERGQAVPTENIHVYNKTLSAESPEQKHDIIANCTKDFTCKYM